MSDLGRMRIRMGDVVIHEAASRALVGSMAELRAELSRAEFRAERKQTARRTGDLEGGRRDPLHALTGVPWIASPDAVCVRNCESCGGLGARALSYVAGCR